jgi:ferric-dicitrate binding protein FerR (iron transport regulator)
MEKEIPWKKLGKYISGEASVRERREIEVWINADPIHAELLEELQDIWSTKENVEWDVDGAWNTLSIELTDERETMLKLLDTTESEVPHKSYSFSRSGNKLWKLAIAASLALVVGVLASVYLLLEPSVVDEPPAMQQLIVEKGERSQFKLSDGTQVWLNSDSRLKVPSQFNGDVREVYLKGEAFFDVAPNSDKPFVIQAGESVTTVLGTEFNVRAYPNEEEQVVVKEGKVTFGSRDAKEAAPELKKNKMGILSRNNELTVNEVSDLESYISWTEGKLIFKDTPLHEVAKKLERRYDVECTIEDPSLKGRTVTATFQEENITEILNIITLSVGISYEKRKQSIRFLNGETKHAFE